MPTIENKSPQGSFYSASNRSSNLITIPSGATCTPDLTQGDVFFFTANQNFTLNAPTVGAGGLYGNRFILYVKQDSTGGRTMTISSSNYATVGGSIALSTPLGVTDQLEAYWNGSIWILTISKNYQTATYYRPATFTGTNVTWTNTANIIDGTPASPGTLDTTTSGTATTVLGSNTTTNSSINWNTQSVTPANCTLYIRASAGNNSGLAMTLSYSINNGTNYTTIVTDGGGGLLAANYSASLTGLQANDLVNLKVRTVQTRVVNSVPPPATVSDSWAIYDCYVVQVI